MSFQELRSAVEGEIFDYRMLMYCLRAYKKPRDKITRLLNTGSIVRVRKGLYVFGSDYQRRPLSQEILANLVYSPSYISLEFALSRYGLIPERTYVITSVCLSRSKTFTTPIATFVYKKRPIEVYPIGIDQVELVHEGSYLIATREKALVDLVSQARGMEDVDEMKEYLYENMRMEQSDLKKLNKKLLIEIIDSYRMSHTILKAIYD